MPIDPVLTGQRYRVTLQLLDAEQLRAKQLGIMVVAQRIPGACQKPDFFDDYEILLERIRGGQCSTGLVTSACRKLMLVL